MFFIFLFICMARRLKNKNPPTRVKVVQQKTDKKINRKLAISSRTTATKYRDEKANKNVIVKKGSVYNPEAGGFTVKKPSTAKIFKAPPPKLDPSGTATSLRPRPRGVSLIVPQKILVARN